MASWKQGIVGHSEDIAKGMPSVSRESRLQGGDLMGDVFFTSDMHFSHGGSLRTFKRPFSSTQEMDETIMKRWNRVVRPGDKVFVLGDFIVHPRADFIDPSPIFQRLNGQKYLIVGNHDRGPTLKLDWVWVKREGFLKGLNSTGIWLCHFPQKTWRDSEQGSWHLFGHRHGNLPPRRLSFDVGVDCWDFKPVSLEEVRMKMERLSNGQGQKIEENQLEFYRRVLRDGRCFIAKRDKHYRVEYQGEYFTLATLVYYLAHPDEGPLKDGEQIHHKDGNRLNDHPDNLQRISRKEHEDLHRGQQDVAMGPLRKLWWSITTGIHTRRTTKMVVSNSEMSAAAKHSKKKARSETGIGHGGASMGNRPKVDKQKFIEDLRSGTKGEVLRHKYQMTPTAFQNLLDHLLQEGRITNDDLSDIGTTSTTAHSLDGSQRPEIGVHESKESHSRGQDGSFHVPTERMVVVDDFLRDPLLRLIAVIDQCNHAAKQGDWHQSDLDTFYQMKDAFMERIYRNPPMGMEVKIKLVPYLRRCPKCKDQAGNAMRSEANSHNFEYYLERIPPCGNDYEDAERASLEMDVRYLGRMFCFHIPLPQAKNWGVEMSALERKTWIPAKEFNRMRFAPIFDEIRALLGLLT